MRAFAVFVEQNVEFAPFRLSEIARNPSNIGVKTSVVESPFSIGTCPSFSGTFEKSAWHRRFR